MQDSLADEASGNENEIRELTQAVRELAARVAQLELRLDVVTGRAGAATARPAARVTPISGPRNADNRLESRIGSQWLNRVGVVAVLFGVAYLLRYIFETGWVSAEAWIWGGVLAGLVVDAASEGFRRRGYRVLSISLKATGLGMSYLSLWAGLELYQIFSGPLTFAALVLLTALDVASAVRESAQVLAALALLGGFLTPLLISIPASEGPLFLYLFILDGAAIVLAAGRKWWKLLPLAIGGTAVLASVWYFHRYTLADLTSTVAGATAFFILFAAAAHYGRRSTAQKGSPQLLLALEIVIPGFYFVALYLLLDMPQHNALAAATAFLSALYFGLAWRGERREKTGSEITTYAGLGTAFAALMLAIALNSDWLSLGWFVEAAVIMGIGFWRDLPRLRWGALVLLCAAIIKAFVVDVWQLSLGYRTLSFIGLGVVLLVISFAYQRHGFSMGRAGKESGER